MKRNQPETSFKRQSKSISSLKRLAFVYLIPVGLISLSNAAMAQSTPEASSFLACQTIENSTTRLNCYDLAASKLNPQTDAKAENTPQLVTPRAPVEFGESSLRSSIGATAEMIERDNHLTRPSIKPQPSPTKPLSKKMSKEEKVTVTKEISVPLKKVDTFGYEKKRFFLENGQVWDQVDTRRVRISKNVMRENPTVAIKKGALGAFYLRINDEGRAISVRRVR